MARGIVAIVQARMGSSRLPGKSLMPIMGRPLLWHVIHRLRASRLIDGIVVATTTAPQDDALSTWAETEGVTCVRGSEDDVLGRFALASEAAGNPDIIVRVNADAPLIDAGFIDAMVQLMLDEESDFVMLRPGVFVAHDGVDPMSGRALRLMLDEARDDPVAREHVTAWLKLHADRIKVSILEPAPAYLFQGARLSVDTPADVAFIEAVHQRLAAPAGEVSLTALIDLLRRDPRLMDVNSHVRQKAPTAASGTVLIRCDGGQAIGLGHVKRCLSLARSLRDAQGLGVVFAVIGEDHAARMIEAGGFPVRRKAEDDDEADWLGSCLSATGAQALVLDVRTELLRGQVEAWRERAFIVALDDGSPRRHAAHLAVYAPVPQVSTFRSTPDTEVLIGWSWSILGFPAWTAPRASRPDHIAPRVLVAMGGSDPGGLTIPAVEALASLGDEVVPVVVLGPAMQDRDTVEARSRQMAPHAEIHIAPLSLLDLAADCDLAILAFGVSAYECAHVGTPALYLGLTPDHVQSSQGFHDAGFGVNLGLAERLQPAAIADAVAGLLADPARRHAMAEAGRSAIDGQGAERLAARIAEGIKTSRLSSRRAV